MSQIAESPLKISVSDRIVAEQCIARNDVLSFWILASEKAEGHAGNPACKTDWWYENVVEPLAKRYVEALGGTYESCLGSRYILGRRIFVSRGKWAVDDQRP